MTSRICQKFETFTAITVQQFSSYQFTIGPFFTEDLQKNTRRIRWSDCGSCTIIPQELKFLLFSFTFAIVLLFVVFYCDSKLGSFHKQT